MLKLKELESFKVMKMNELSVSTIYASRIFGETEAEITADIEKFKSDFSSSVKDIKTGVMEHGEPQKGSNESPLQGITREQFQSATPAKRAEHLANVKQGKLKQEL